MLDKKMEIMDKNRYFVEFMYDLEERLRGTKYSIVKEKVTDNLSYTSISYTQAEISSVICDLLDINASELKKERRELLKKQKNKGRK